MEKMVGPDFIYEKHPVFIGSNFTKTHFINNPKNYLERIYGELHFENTKDFDFMYECNKVGEGKEYLRILTEVYDGKTERVIGMAWVYTRIKNLEEE